MTNWGYAYLDTRGTCVGSAGAKELLDGERLRSGAKFSPAETGSADRGYAAYWKCCQAS